ncbi:cytochrome P450 family protein [Streptomyces griseocarneus]|uniref:cytochrome P450 family protein n=1 Tax=Streptomyces griseocarneus TaxID=51201 RepID=UPI00167C6A90|nr:cytochrome P450 [Streptomyces griseocarneus]MBZ6474824.1 cytochrome P450 [Streptomyces griseocarneus]GHG48308.1 cytochrome P450 [Streptomyces griseocarneus]
MQPIDVTALIEDPYGTYAALREAGPVHRITGSDGRPAWLVTRYDDVRRALADPRLSLDRSHALPGNYSGFSLPPALDANLLNMDPPDHTRVRRLVVKAFTPGRVDRLRAPVRQVADELLDALEAGDERRTDLLESYAGPLPIIVICDLLGIPPHARQDFRAWTDAMITPDRERPHLMKEAVAGLMGYFTGLIRDKRAEPADDLLSDLIAVRDGEDALSEDELTSLAFLILFAGYENTVHLIVNAVLALLDHPALLSELRANPDGLGAAVEEIGRWDGPSPLAIRRFPLEDVEIGGVTVPAGETVLLSIASANRDPGHFPDPDRLDLRRDRSGHLALGHGIHYCLGAPLARMETETALAALLERFKNLELDVPREALRWRPAIRARGLISLPVRW